VARGFCGGWDGGFGLAGGWFLPSRRRKGRRRRRMGRWGKRSCGGDDGRGLCASQVQRWILREGGAGRAVGETTGSGWVWLGIG
jgi:hypothetical protein